ncbi:hypothetical protein ACB092_11G014200 [Castanea dentata]
MADSTPLLSQANSAESQSTTPPLEKHRPSLDFTIERCIGVFGWAQFFQTLLVSLAWLFDAQQTFISVFTDAYPTWHCTTHPHGCDSVSNICYLPKNSWAWDWPSYTSIISEWKLECSSSIITGLPASSFFMGCLVGGFVLATLADSSLGRKNMIFLSCLTMSLSSLLTVFSTNIWVYSALRLVCGFGRATIGTSALVLTAELVGKRWRGQVGVIGFFCFTIGFLSLPAIAYLNRGSSWRSLYLWTSIPGIFYSMLVHFFVRESPRWLFVRGRKEEAVATLKSIATPSRSSCLTWSFSEVSFQEERCNNGNIFSTIKMLVQKRWAFRRLLPVLVIGFGSGMVYYGMPLGLGNLSFNLYLSVTLNALAEIPSSLITMLLIATSLVRQAVVFGGVFGPMLVAADRRDGISSYGVFGLVIGCCGLFAICLPETRGRALCDTMDEEEQKEKAICNDEGDVLA